MLGVEASTIDGVLGALQLRDLDQLAALLGADSEAVAELRRLWELAAGYGFQVRGGGGEGEERRACGKRGGGRGAGGMEQWRLGAEIAADVE